MRRALVSLQVLKGLLLEWASSVPRLGENGNRTVTIYKEKWYGCEKEERPLGKAAARYQDFAAIADRALYVALSDDYDSRFLLRLKISTRKQRVGHRFGVAGLLIGRTIDCGPHRRDGGTTDLT